MAIFLTVVGASNYALLNDVCAPAKPKDKTLEFLVGKLKDQFEPEPSIIAEWYYFCKRIQRPSESIADFVAELRRLATCCKENLRDQVVCGLHNNATMQYLLLEKNPDLAKVIQIATSRQKTLL